MASIYSILRDGLLLSGKTGKPVTTHQAVVRIVQKLGCERVGDQYIVPLSKIDEWNKAVKIMKG